MLDGVYRNPTTIIFGKDSETQVGEEVMKFGKKVLLHYGNESFNKFGLGAKIKTSLADSDISFIELGGVTADPNADLVYAGIELCRIENIDFILAVGGASVIDSAKAIAIGVPYEGDFFDFFENISLPRKMLNIGVVLTISGAGSESSNAAVITKSNKKYSCGSPVMFPLFAIMNPELTYTVPEKLTACGVVDSISHVLERYFSNTSDVDTSDRICESLIKTLMKLGRNVMKTPLDYGIRAELMWAAKLAHDNTAGFGRKQDWATHTIAHEIGARYDQPHGSILAVVFPAWMKFMSQKNELIFKQFSQRVFDIESETMNIPEPIISGIEAYEDFLLEMGMPTSLHMLGVMDKSEFTAIAQACSKTTQSGTIGNLTRLNEEDIIEILTLCA